MLKLGFITNVNVTTSITLHIGHQTSFVVIRCNWMPLDAPCVQICCLAFESMLNESPCIRFIQNIKISQDLMRCGIEKRAKMYPIMLLF